MATIIRSVHNTLSTDIVTSHTNVVIPASSTLDLYTVITGYELLQLQSELAEMVASGSLTVVASDDISEVLAVGVTNVATAAKPIATGHAYKFETTDATGNLQETTVTASRAVATDANGLPTASATTDVELGYVSGVTSSIQTQLGSLLPLAGGTMTGDLTFSNGNKVILGNNPAVGAGDTYISFVGHGGMVGQDSSATGLFDISGVGELDLWGFSGSDGLGVYSPYLFLSATGAYLGSTIADRPVFITQLDVPIAKFDNSVTAGETRFLIWDVDTAVLQRVSVGANDSGGVGYRLLKIPNA